MVDALEYEPDSACLSDEEIAAFSVGRLDESRRARAHSHLDCCEVCQLLLSEAAHGMTTAVSVPSFEADNVDWHTTFQPGSIVGRRYLIRQFIARGGMGEVYEAFDRDLQERVALKTVTATACDNPLAVRRLKGEVQLARRVSHPNVCRIYDFGSHVMANTGELISFLTMEFVDGETLGHRLRQRGALPIDEARRLGRQMLQGLHAAHAAGVLHRDFKSDNVLLKEDVNGQLQPLILDFGLARALEEDARRARSASHAGPIGTVSYLAPEQLEGEPHSTASDIYALGLVWFEMLTGELPFEGSPTPAVAALERMHKQVPAPSSRNLEVPRDLDAIVLGCLRRSPKQRFKTTAQVLAALDELESRSRPTFRVSKRWLVGAFACTLSVLGLGAIGYQSPARPELSATQSTALPADIGPRSAPQEAPRAVAAPPAKPAPSPKISQRTPVAPKRRSAQELRTAGSKSVAAAAAASSLDPRVPEGGWEDPFPSTTPEPSQKSL